MADEGEDGNSDPKQGLTGAAAASLLEVWQDGSEDAVYRCLAINVAPRLVSHLRAAYFLQEADCQDCLSDAYDRFGPAVRSRKLLANPYGYFFKIGINAALKLLRERQAEPIDPNIDPEGAATGDEVDVADVLEAGLAITDPPAKIAVELVEDAVSELEVEDFWAVEVMRLAIGRLSPGLRRVMQSLMYRDLAFVTGGSADFDFSAQDAAAELGIKPGAFRTAKHRAYAAIRESVPALIVELGLTPPERAEAAIFPHGRVRFLDEDEDL